MTNPIIELKAKKQQFISIRELIIRIESKFPDMTRDQIANWIVIKLDEAEQYAPQLLIQDSRGLTRRPSLSDPSFNSYELLNQVMVNPDMDEAPYEGWSPSRTSELDLQNSSESIFDDNIPF
ncbi:MULTISPECIES: hypothetical protein [unclassified Pantoea]|uniref:hypothetical protein n=1 Tax=unclassified Pantoea TaxID=2630326 RepID=UPI0024776A57|nr:MULTISPECIES: hypothetical protein [unclassified Pantoea]GME35640.1 hypothetical protein ACJ1_15330 [Pantoea sp. QMID1]